MKRILCYGDSNTWGYTGGTGSRYSREVRWTGVVQHVLGPDYQVIEEGMNGRTTVYDRPDFVGRNGKDYLLPCLISQKPLDLLVLMLGTNDLMCTDAYGAAGGVRYLIELIRTASYLQESSWIFSGGKGAARILLIAPVRAHPCVSTLDEKRKRRHFYEESLLFSELYEKAAKETGCDFLDASLFAEACTADGIHMTRESHTSLGMAIAAKITEILR